MTDWRRVVAGAGILLGIPALVEAHTIGGSSSWSDELICLVPAMILLGAVFFLGRDDKGKSGKGK